MLYTIIGQDVAESTAGRKTHRQAHLARLQALRDAGRLVLAGPFPAIDCEEPGAAGFSGSLIVAEFESLQEARIWANADPYVAGGVYASTEVLPFRAVSP